MHGSRRTKVRSEPPPHKSHYQATWIAYKKKNANVMQGSLLQAVVLLSRLPGDARATLSLVTKVGTVLVESAQVSVVRGCGAEEDGGRQVIASIFEELVHLSGHARLHGYSVA